MKKTSALRRLFVFCGALIAFLLARDPGLVTMMGPDIELPAWHVRQPCPKPTQGRLGCHVLQRIPSVAPVPASAGRAVFGRLHAVLTPWRVYAQSAAPAGFSPADIQDAYKLTSAVTGPTTPTVAVIVAYDDPNIEAELGVYRSTFGLPPCTTANGCFAKVNQQGDIGGTISSAAVLSHSRSINDCREYR